MQRGFAAGRAGRDGGGCDQYFPWRDSFRIYPYQTGRRAVIENMAACGLAARKKNETGFGALEDR
jgi:hypothetical protein